MLPGTRGQGPKPPPQPKSPPLHKGLPSALGAQRVTRGYFLAYRGFGGKGKKKEWLDKEIDQIGNGFAINYARYGNFKWFYKRKVVAAKKPKIFVFSSISN